jgi:hypothetical protein
MLTLLEGNVMNDRIREIAWEFGLPTYNPEGIPTKLGMFAEALIKEVLEQVRDEVQYEYDLYIAGAITDRVKQHFGVE